MVFGVSTAAADTRWHEYTGKYKHTADQAKVVGSTYLGGKGTEWFSGGGFQPDGTAVCVGVSLGPVLEIAGSPVPVMGRDAAAPPAPELTLQTDNQGKPKTDKEGRPKYDRLSWEHENATAFIVRLTPDLKQVVSASRFPWMAGGATSARVDEEGNIYMAGPAGPNLQNAGGNFAEVPPPSAGENVRPIFLAKLSPDAQRVLWMRRITGESAAPKISLNRQRQVVLEGAGLMIFDAEGTLMSSVETPAGMGGLTAVNPNDGTIARGGERHWRTGREPWRCPRLNIHKPDGSLLYELYHWPGPYVGVDHNRLVSDSAVRGVMYDNDGNLVIHAWSDGGNSVMGRQPQDVWTSHGAFEKSLGFSPWGANVLSAAYILRINPETYQVDAGTLWLSFLMEQNKPNSIWIRAMDFANDGSVLIAGGSASGLIQTGNHLNEERMPGGNYVAVLSKDFDSIRFSSAMIACGASDVANQEPWGMARGTVAGKERVMFLSGATAEGESYGDKASAPVKNAIQPEFGGGLLDGHVLVLEL